MESVTKPISIYVLWLPVFSKASSFITNGGDGVCDGACFYLHAVAVVCI